MIQQTLNSSDIIQVQDLRKSYGNLKAVDGVSFSISSGEVFGILGPNGAGKTTTVEILEGIRAPDSGTVFVDGIDVRKDPRAVKKIILALEDYKRLSSYILEEIDSKDKTQL